MKSVIVCVLVQMCRVVYGSYAEEMARATQLCCNQGTAYGRQHTLEDCSSSSPPAVPTPFGSLCILAMDDCCKQYFQKKKDCDTGVDIASSTHQCESTLYTAQSYAGFEPTSPPAAAAAAAGPMQVHLPTMPPRPYTCCNECRRGMNMSAHGAIACEASPVGSAAEELLAGDAFQQCCVKAVDHHEETHVEPLMPATRPVARNSADRSSLCEEYAPNELCAHHCIPVPGSYKCQCNPGYMLMADGRNCKAVEKNRCKPRNPCHHKCNDNGEAEIKCSCRRGYELMADGKSCQDIDECLLNPPVCLSGTQCFNVHGSFKCIPVRNHISAERGACPDGFARNPVNHACDDINECLLPNPPCSSYLCENTIGGYKCGGVTGDPSNLSNRVTPPAEDRCPAGFRAGRDEECEDIDECVTHDNDCNQLSQFCINTRGSFYCQDRTSRYCPPGFKIDPATSKCEDINECEDEPETCGGLVCVNLLGLYDCRAQPVNHCPDGMRLRKDSAICEDIDECLEGTHLCDQHQNCLNTNGSHECRCKIGYELHVTTGACVDINECATDRHNCLPRSQRCDNTVGSYLCVRMASCGTGYTLQHTTGLCEDIDECDLGLDDCTHSGAQVKCINIPGSFRCEIIRPSTTTPEYEYYYDEDEDNITQSQPNPPAAKPDPPTTTTQRPEPKPITTPSTPPTQPTTPPARPEDRRPEDNNVYFNHADLDTPRSDLRNAAPTPSTYYETGQEPETAVRSKQPRTPEQPTEPERPREPEVREPERSIEPIQPRQPEQPIETIQPQEPEQPRETERPTPNYYPPREPPRQPELRVFEPQTPQTPLYRPPEPQIPEISQNPEDTVRPEITSPRLVDVDQKNPVTATVNGQRGRDGSVFVDTSTVPENRWTRINERPVDCQLGFEMDSYGACFDIDECAVGSHSCSQTETCRNTMGAYVCDCRVGYQRELATGNCVLIRTTPPPTTPAPITPAPTTRVTAETTTEFDLYRKYWGIHNHRTTRRPFRPRNLCDVGFHHNSTTDKCEDVNECLNGQANCADVEQCINTEGGYRCECPPHWVLDVTRHRCVPVRSSQLIPPGYSNEPEYPQVDQRIPHDDLPTKFVEPTLTGQGNDQTMSCQWGYRLGRDNVCEDINECLTGEARCGPGQLCTNFPSGYTCSCPRGHRLIGDHQCEDVDECLLAGNQSICSEHADCVNSVGSYQCRCHTGFRAAPANDKVCVDVDECTESPAGSLCEQRCNNVWGSYRCSCHRGYRLNPDNRTCADVDECTEFSSKLLCFGRCLNEPGSYRCTCPPGYRLSEDKRSCIDIDECETGDPCAAGMYGGVSNVCLNTRGSYRCQKITCPPGYRLESKNRCTKIEKVCHPTDWECAHQPSKYSYHFITFVSKLYIPENKVNLFVMRGPSWPNAKERFELVLKDVNAPPTVRERADIKAFLLTQTGNQASVSLVRSLEGPQTIELELSMELYSGETFGGIAVAKLFIHVSEYEF